jgi:hypothetical protein
MYWRICIFAVGTLLLAQPAIALRCGSRLISDGAPQGKVLRYCGEPESVQVRTLVRAGLPRNRSFGRARHRFDARISNDSGLFLAERAYEEIVIEEWTYNFGPRRLMRVIRFENGLVTSIKQLGYGYH